MTFKAKLMLCTAAFAFAGTMASAAITANDVVKSYQDAAYTYIEVKDGLTQIKVEAIKDGVKVEAVYDKATGDVLKTESHTVPAGEAGLSGVEVDTVSDDFADQPSGSDDDSDDDASDDSDDGSDDHSGSGGDDDHGDDSDDDSGDDHSGSGSSHDGNDDHGSDSHDSHGGSDGSGDDD